MEPSSETPLHARLRLLSHLTGGLLTVLGILALIGWHWDIDVLRRPMPDTVAMNPLTALLFMVIGIVLATSRTGVGRTVVWPVSAALVTAAAMMKLLAMIIGSDMAPDALLFASKLNGEIGLITRNRMAPNTALCFLLAGISLLLHRVGTDSDDRATLWGEALAVTVFLLALIPLLGYVYEIREFYGVLNYIPMALHTALGFVALSSAILFANPDARFMSVLTGNLSGSYALRLLLPVALLAPVGLGLLRVYGQRAGLFTPEFGTMVAVVLEIVILSLLIWKVAMEVNRSDREKLRAEEAMAELTTRLEQRVKERTAELRETVRELVDKEKRYRGLADRFTTLIAASNTGAWEFNEETGFLWCSDEYFTMLGHDPKDFDLSGAPNMKEVWTDLLHPDDRDRPDRHFSESLAVGDGMYENTFRMRHKEGHYLWILSRGRTLTDANGRPTPITVGTHIDITRRVEAEEEHLRSEERYRTLAQRFGTLISASNTGAWEFDHDTGHRWCSREYYTMLGYSGEDDPDIVALGDGHRVWLSLIHPDDREEADRRFAKYLTRPKGMYENTFRMRHRDGRWIWVWSRGRTLTDGDGNRTSLTVGTHIDITERKLAEQKLAESEERFRHTLDNMLEGVQIIDFDFRYMYVNDALTKHGGMTAGQLQGITMMEAYPGIEGTEVFRHIRECMESRVPHRMDNEFRYPDGSTAFFDLSIQPVPEGVFILSIDKTEERRAAKELEESEERYRTTLDNMLEGVQIVGFNFEYLYINRTLEKQGGYTWEQLKGRTMPEVYPGLEQSEVYSYIKRSLEERITLHLETEFTFPGGSAVWFELSIQPVPEGVFMLSIDITERKRAEADARAKSEELKARLKELTDYKHALDQGAIVAITDVKGIITHVNANFCRISGYSEEELLGQDHRIINSGHHPKEFIRDLWVTIANGNIWTGELKNKAKDGTHYWVDTTIVPFLNTDGKPDRYLAIRSDITHRKIAEQEILRLNEGLEHTVAERTAQLQAVNKELEAFSYSVSHDLRAPLRAVNGFSDMLLQQYDTRLDDNGRRLLTIVKENATTMGQLIDDLLEFSRTGRKELVPVKVNMTELAEESLRELTQHDPGRADAVTIAKLPLVKGDRQLLKQVFINLISNALKYSSKKTEPKVEVWADTDADGSFAFHVRDNGAGFDMAYAGKLFGVFQRLHSKREFDGTGVGLALVQRIITRHGGRVWAEGEVDRGATFHFTIPGGDSNGKTESNGNDMPDIATEHSA